MHQMLARHRRQQVEVAFYQRILGDQGERMFCLRQYLDEPARQPQLALGRLIGVGIDAQRDRLRLVAPLRQLAPQYFRRVGLGEDPGLEIQPGRQVQVGVRGTRKAVRAPVFYGNSDFCSVAVDIE